VGKNTRLDSGRVWVPPTGKKSSPYPYPKGIRYRTQIAIPKSRLARHECRISLSILCDVEFDLCLCERWSPIRRDVI
jgi:hypothetical protein